MRSLMIALIIGVCSQNAQSSALDKCNLSVLQYASNENKRCYRESATRYEQSLCNAEADKFVARNACSIALIDYGRAAAFIHERMADVDNPKYAKRVPIEQRNARYQELKRMLDRQYQESTIAFDNEMDRVDAERSAARANAAINNSIFLIGGTNINRVNSNTFTYIYQGKPTTCTTVGNVISCL